MGGTGLAAYILSMAVVWAALSCALMAKRLLHFT